MRRDFLKIIKQTNKQKLVSRKKTKKEFKKYKEEKEKESVCERETIK